MAEFSSFLTPLVKTDQYSVTPLAGDASTRRYYRVATREKSWVLMEWEPFEQITDFPFLSVQKYFSEKGIRVPKIHHYDKNIGLFLLEDLGDLTLERRFWELQHQESILPFYKQSLDQLIKIHSLSFSKKTPRVCTAYKNEFSIEKLLWELNYAKKYLLQGLLKINLSERLEKSLEAEFLALCEQLYKSPQVICHRDFHSRNIMLSFDKVTIIDFQDARLGPPVYDLVSLFYDSYVDLKQSSIDLLMTYYCNQFPHFPELNISPEQWCHFFELQTIQRCFKACGSFASFKVTRNDNRYLSYIRPTLSRVLRHLEKFNPTSDLQKVLQDAKSQWGEL